MDLTKHYIWSRVGYLIGILVMIFHSSIDGLEIIVISWLGSKIWHLQNTDSHIEEYIQADIKARKRKKKKRKNETNTKTNK